DVANAVIDGADGVVMHEASIHDAIGAMSPRQLQVLRLMLRGLPNKEICRELGLSENTVKIHIGAVLRALQARNRTEAVARASRVGFSSGD
ncbi:MAG: response regulator transcription factor, partial [Burkholderiaceae bacterium]